MTAQEVANLANARTTGVGKWQARCPAHDDRSPSLSISLGREERVLVHCFAGCTLHAVLEGLGVSAIDLFPGPRLTKAGFSAFKADLERREQAASEERRELRQASQSVWKWRRIVDVLGERLVLAPEDECEALAKHFHDAVDHFHHAEMIADAAEARVKLRRAEGGAS